ncbi:hypothetical protein ACFL1B_00250 [Nanoarchaeota archaeon]
MGIGNFAFAILATILVLGYIGYVQEAYPVESSYSAGEDTTAVAGAARWRPSTSSSGITTYTRRSCGNGDASRFEQCDTNDFKGRTCHDYGFDAGSLTCTSRCRIKMDGCYDAPVSVTYCGDGNIDTGEDCDGSNLGGFSCSDWGFNAGDLKCMPRQCKFDNSGCYDAPVAVCSDNDNPDSCLDVSHCSWDAETDTCIDYVGPSPSTCNDPDGGLDYYNQAHAFGYSKICADDRDCRYRSGGRDYCVDGIVGANVVSLREMYCDDEGHLASVYYTCEFGCVEGACLQSPVGVCPEPPVNIREECYLINITNTTTGCIDYAVGCPVASCTDSDGGIDGFTFGYTTTTILMPLLPNIDTMNYDSCIQNTLSPDSKVLQERYCDGDKDAYTRIDCPYGCKDGACLAPPVATCPDSIKPTEIGCYLVEAGQDNYGCMTYEKECVGCGMPADPNCQYVETGRDDFNCPIYKETCICPVMPTTTDNDIGCYYVEAGQDNNGCMTYEKKCTVCVAPDNDPNSNCQYVENGRDQYNCPTYDKMCEINTCDDSDGGKNTYVKGACTSYNQVIEDMAGISVQSDYCKYTSYSKTGVLMEAYCGSNGCEQAEVKCPWRYICRAGKCVRGSSSDPICIDTDGGKDPNVQGTISSLQTTGSQDWCYLSKYRDKLEGGAMTDSCSNSVGMLSDTYCGVFEYYCKNDDEDDAAFMECKYGCSDGACLAPPVATCPDSIKPTEIGCYLVEAGQDNYGCMTYEKECVGCGMPADPNCQYVETGRDKYNCPIYKETCVVGTVCGNKVRENQEECDTNDFGGRTCQTQGFDDGNLRCSASCKIETDGCFRVIKPTEVCGNKVREGQEECDSNDFRGLTCKDYKFDGGDLRCSASCLIETDSCYKVDSSNTCECTSTSAGFIVSKNNCETNNRPYCDIIIGTNDVKCECREIPPPTTLYCGDGMINGNEVCDGYNFGGQTCVGLGFAGGYLVCSNDCKVIDVGSCVPVVDPPYCGDGVINPGEYCDGNNFGGLTCQDAGFDGGTLNCGSNCVIDVSGCYIEPDPYVPVCGNGYLEDGEDCDGDEYLYDDVSCREYGYTEGTISCTSDCIVSTRYCEYNWRDDRSFNLV